MTEFSIPANPVFFLELGVHLQSVPLLPTKTTVCEVQSFPSVIILRMNAWHVIFSAYLFLLPLPQAQSLSEPCFTPQNKSFGQMVAGTGGERCQKRSCVPGQWGAHTAPLRDWGWHTSPPLGTKNTPSGDNSGAGEGLLCLNYLAVPLRPASESQNLTKMYSKAKTPMKMFSVFSSRMTHMASAMKTVPCFKASFEWETSSWMLYLILITRITLSASQSILLSYGWWFLTAAHDFLQNLSWKAKVSFKVWLHGLVLWIREAKSKRQDWLADETVVKFMAVSHMLTENSDKNKQCFFFALGSSSLVCQFSANVIPSSQKQICGKQRPEIGDGNYG